MRILLCGHACAPELGSEPGVTWNWAWHLSEKHEVWALVHPEHRLEIESYLRRNPKPRLNFVWVSLPRWLDPWRPAEGERWIHVHYVLWQYAALSNARRLHRRINFDVCHFVSWATVLASPLLWKLPVPFFWGPVGGAQTVPWPFHSYLRWSWRKELLRRVRIRLRRATPSFRNAVRKSALILSSNGETRDLLAAAGARRIALFPADSGVPPELIEAPCTLASARTDVVIHWSGRISPHKGLPLALEGFARACRNSAVPLRLEISGDGPDRTYCEALVHDLGLAQRVRFLGYLPRSEVLQHLRQADALLFTSLRDTVGSVCLESMAAGLPIVLLDHQGVRHFVPPEASWRVLPTTAPETVANLAIAIQTMAENPEDRARRAQAALAFARSQTWTERVKLMEDLYDRFRHSDRLSSVSI